MQRFTRELIESHCAGVVWPKMLGTVQVGEQFIIETERFNRVNGPIAVAGIRAGENIVVHIEAIAIEPPFEAPNGGPFFEGMGAPVPIDYRDGRFFFPHGLSLPAKPSIGNVGVLPAPTPNILALAERDSGPPRADHRGWGWRGVINDPRGKHCHQDCQALAAGASIHFQAQVDEVGLCVADVHGYIGQGEMAFAGIEVAAQVQLRVERSTGWYVDWPLIETADEIMVFCSDTNLLHGTTDQQYVDVVRQAYAEMRKVVAHRLNDAPAQAHAEANNTAQAHAVANNTAQAHAVANSLEAESISAANAIVAAALDIRNCALYGLGDFVQPDGKKAGQPDQDIAVVGALPKAVFA